MCNSAFSERKWARMLQARGVYVAFYCGFGLCLLENTFQSTCFWMCVIYCYGEKRIMEHDSFIAVKSTFAIYSAIKDRISS